MKGKVNSFYLKHMNNDGILTKRDADIIRQRSKRKLIEEGKIQKGLSDSRSNFHAIPIGHRFITFKGKRMKVPVTRESDRAGHGTYRNAHLPDGTTMNLDVTLRKGKRNPLTHA